MPLYQRAGSPHWWVRISIAGRETRRSTGTQNRQSAEEFEQRERERLWRLHKLGDRGAVRWKEVAARWLKETTKRSIAMDRMILTWFAQHLDEEMVMSIDHDAIEVLREHALHEGMAPATVDRYFALIRAILRKCAAEWRYLESAPKVSMYRPEQGEPRWLTHAEFASLLKQLPDHLKLCARFAVLTGLRMRSMLALTWDRIDLPNKRLRIPGKQMKAGRSLGIPLSAEAVRVLKDARKFSPNGQHVFQYDGTPIGDCNTRAFKLAVERAKVEPLRWHDLRHTFASWAVQGGVTLHELMQLGGWASYQMVLRYAHLAPDHLASAAEKIGTKSRTVKKRAAAKK